MSGIQFKSQPSPEKDETFRSGRATGSSAGTTAIGLGIALVDAELSSGIPGCCPRCESRRDVRTSTAQYPNVFCSEECEQEFIQTALASLTLEDCIRIHERLENLLTLG